MQHNQENLVDLLKSGDIKAFETFVKEYEKKIYSYAYNFTSDMNDALDITQEVFLKVHKNIGKFKENSSLSTWVYRITSNVCIDFSRKQKPTIPITEENQEYIYEIADNSSDLDSILATKEISNEIYTALNKLDENSKQIVIMRDISGLSYNEIADILKLEIGTVKSRIARSRKKLRDILLSIRNNSTYFPSKEQKEEVN